MANENIRIALIDDDPQLRPVLARILEDSGYSPEVFESGDRFLEARGPASFDIVVTDFQMEGATGIDVLKACRAEEDPPEVLLLTGFASIRTAVEAMRLGALDYLAKPVDPTELLLRISHVIGARKMKREVEALSGEVRRRHGVTPPIGDSRVMRGFLERARKVAATSSTVLILGETGSGKDVVARFIQASGPRAERTYLTLNCAALPETLLESELFGHARGAFSGAHALKRGLFEEADGGTLFLDEIGSLSPAAQAKLLRVLEENAVRRVGETGPIKVDVRILAATNRDLSKAVENHDFREDLFYRLSVVTLVVPALRERREDIPALARTFLAESVQRLGKFRTFAPDTISFLERHPFPGNVRELRYAIEQAAILSEDGMIRPADFTFVVPRSGPRVHPAPRELTAEELDRALRENGGNRVRAARALGISRATLYRLLDRVPGKGAPAAGAGDVESE